MLSFLIGFGTGFCVLHDAAAVRRTVVRAVFDGYDLAATLAKGAYRTSVEIKEDFEDTIAEVKAERTVAEVDTDSTLQVLQDLQNQIVQLRAELAKE